MKNFSTLDIAPLLIADEAYPLQLQPPDFDEERLTEDIRAMKRCIELATKASFEENLRVQDAYFIGWISAQLGQFSNSSPNEKMSNWFVVRFSNFGKFAAYWNTDDTSVSSKLLQAAQDCCKENGFLLMSAAVLQSTPYVGIHEYFKSKTWWDRFFEYD